VAESEDLCYIDDDATLAIRDSEVPTLQPQSNPEETAMNPGESSGLKARDPIDLDAPEIEESAAHASRSPPSVSDDLNETAVKAAEEITPVPAMTANVFQLEDAGMILLLEEIFRVFPTEHVFRSLTSFDSVLILAAKTLVTLSSKDKEKELLQLEVGPSAPRTGLDPMLVEPGTISHRLFYL
jgi:hypothetical protein